MRSLDLEAAGATRDRNTFELHEDPFVRLDLGAQRLWRGTELVRLRPKTWDVLCYIAKRPGLLVMKDELHREVWRGAAVGEDTLTQSVRELRLALGDDARKPRFVETVHGRGFRWIGTQSNGEPAPSAVSAVAQGQNVFLEPPTRTSVVGRDAELALLREHFERARGGERQVVFVTGQPGIGKTTLVEQFLASPTLRESADPVWLLKGQCIEQYGKREPYMPVLQALERMLRPVERRHAKAIIGRVAPSWLDQLPRLLDAVDGEARPASGAAAPERMLRELTDLVEALAPQAVLVLILEDLHWADVSTVDVVSTLAQRVESARLLLVATLRPAEAMVHKHPATAVIRTLRLRSACTEIALEYLREKDVHEYLRRRLDGARVPDGLAAALRDATDGNPLFVVSLVDHLLKRGSLEKEPDGWRLAEPIERLSTDIPDDLLKLIAAQLDLLSAEDKSVLEIATVAGMSFDAQALAGPLQTDLTEVEARCESLAESGCFLRTVGIREWPDGSIANHYQFIHPLHREALYQRLPAARRRALHQSVAEHIERAFANRAADVAAELSEHFQRANDRERAVTYLLMTAERAVERGAFREALGSLRSALSLVAARAPSDARDQQELEAVRKYVRVAVAVHGYSSADVGDALVRLRTLSEQCGNRGALFDALYALSFFHCVRGDPVDVVRRLRERLHALAAKLGREYRIGADYASATTLMWAGEFETARKCLANVIGARRDRDADRASRFGPDTTIVAMSYESYRLWFIGLPCAAHRMLEDAIARSEERNEPFTLAATLTHGAIVCLFDREYRTAQVLAERAIEMSSTYTFGLWRAAASIVRGRAIAQLGDPTEGLARCQSGFAALCETGSGVFVPTALAFLGQTHLQLERYDDGLLAVEDGIARAASGCDRMYEAELWRTKGELLIARSQAKVRGGKRRDDVILEARRCFQRALRVARRQKAKSLELRAAMSMAQLPQKGAPRDAARGTLRTIYDSFTEGHDTRDLREARALVVTRTQRLAERASKAPMLRTAWQKR